MSSPTRLQAGSFCSPTLAGRQWLFLKWKLQLKSFLLIQRGGGMPEKRRTSSEFMVTTIVHNLTSLSIKPLTSWKIAEKQASCRNASKRITRTFPYKGWYSPRDHTLNTHRSIYHDETETRPVCHFINQITRGLLRQVILCHPRSLNF